MNKQKTIKYDAEYASEVMSKLPLGYVDKTICGCGLSSVALENNVNTIIAVPSVELIRNKVVQYPNSRSNNTILGVFSGVTNDKIDEYLNKAKVIKIMVTYDSLYRVQHLLDKCLLVIDESNKLLSSSALKTSSKKTSKDIDVVSKVFELAKKYQSKVSFISATPTPLEYMPKWVGELPQVKIEWENTIKAMPILMERTYPFKALASELLVPMKVNGFVQLGDTTITKMIVFINSVESIVKAVKEADLDKDDVAIIASNNVSNDVKIKGFNRLQDPTKLPKYTFVTSSGFEGIDLEDKEAISVVVSNTSKSYQMIDIMTDLKQAISRQRDKSNPNYSKFIYLYNQSIFSKSSSELEEELNTKYKSLSKAIAIWENAKRDNLKEGFQYTESNADFIAYTNYITDTETYILNENLFNADRYFILNVREQYSKGFDLKGVYKEHSIVESPVIVSTINYRDMVKIYKETGDIEKYSYKYEYYNLIKETVRLYNKVWEDYSYARSMCDEHKNEYNRVVITVRKMFKEGKRYTLKYVKDTLNEVYKEFDLTRKATATDLKEFVLVKEGKDGKGRYIEVINKNKTIK